MEALYTQPGRVVIRGSRGAMSAARDHTALVTGANRGIGREVGRLLLGAGVRVVLTGRDAAAIAAAAREIAGGGSESFAHHVLDVTQPESLDALCDWLGEAGWRIDILVNNAGELRDDDATLLETGDDVVRASFEVNFFGPLRLCRRFMPGMIERGYGRIVNVSSGYGSISRMEGGQPAAYKLSKAALNALTRLAAGEARGDVKVNAVDPGWVRTRMGGASASRDPSRAAADIVWAATLPAGGPHGRFLLHRKTAPW